MPDALPARPVEFLAVEDLAALLRLSVRGARLVLERGELPGFRIGRRWYLRPADLEAAIARKIEENRPAPGPAPSPDRRSPVSTRPVRRRAPRARSRDPDTAVRILRGLPAARNPPRNP